MCDLNSLEIEPWLEIAGAFYIRIKDELISNIKIVKETKVMTKVKRLAKVREIPIEDIDEFPNHPYKVRDDDEMAALVESIRDNGVMTPAVVRKKKGGNA
jgi:ParB family chromosome partitioning protein